LLESKNLAGFGEMDTISINQNGISINQSINQSINPAIYERMNQQMNEQANK